MDAHHTQLMTDNPCSAALKTSEGLLLCTYFIQISSSLGKNHMLSVNLKCGFYPTRNRVPPRLCLLFSQTINSTSTLSWGKGAAHACASAPHTCVSHRSSALQTLSPVCNNDNCITVQHPLSLSGVIVDPWRPLREQASCMGGLWLEDWGWGIDDLMGTHSRFMNLRVSSITSIQPVCVVDGHLIQQSPVMQTV